MHELEASFCTKTCVCQIRLTLTSLDAVECLLGAIGAYCSADWIQLWMSQQHTSCKSVKFEIPLVLAGCLAPLAAGAAVIMPAEGRFAASTFWRDAVNHQATFYTAVPTMHQILLQRSGTDYPKDKPPPLRFIRSCSSPLAPAVLEGLEAAFHVPVLEARLFTGRP